MAPLPVDSAVSPERRSIAARIEVAQIGRRLAFSRRHQVAVIADEVALFPDLRMMVVLVADVLGPDGIAPAPIGSCDRPGPGQGVIESGDVVMQEVRVGPV